MHSRAIWRLLLAVVAVAVMLTVLSSCRLNIWGPGGDFVGRTYLAVDVTQDGAARPIVPGTRLSITFTEDGISASAGCNTMLSTDAGIEDSVLRVDSLITTEMACDPAVMEQEAWWAAFLTSGPAAEVGDRTLTLTGSTAVVQANAEETIEDLPLTGTTWKLDTIITADAASSVPAGGTSTLALTEQSMTIIVATCRNSTVPVTVAETAISFESAAFGASTCSGEAAAVDGAVLDVLGAGSVEYRIDGTQLIISGPDGKRLGYSGA